VSKNLVLGSLFPDDLNLNGDQANLLVIQKRLRLQDVTSQIVEVASSDLGEVDLLFLGHGSIAAWDFIDKHHPRAMSDIASYFQSGKPLFAVSSGALRVLGQTGRKFTEGDHRSEFVDVDGIVGYLNSPVQDFIFEKIQNSWFTLLHGPVLAKNPGLADQICTELGWVVQPKTSETLLRLDELADASRKIAFES